MSHWLCARCGNRYVGDNPLDVCAWCRLRLAIDNLVEAIRIAIRGSL